MTGSPGEQSRTLRRSEQDDIGGLDDQTSLVSWITHLHDGRKVLLLIGRQTSNETSIVAMSERVRRRSLPWDHAAIDLVSPKVLHIDR